MEPESLTVLVVDDSRTMRLFLAAMLKKNGYTVIEAQNGLEAINIIRERGDGIAAVLSDIHMPQIDGVKLAELNYQNSFLPFIACTVISDAALALELLKFGVRDYLLKPVNNAILLATVRNAIERRKLPRLFADDETPLAGNMGSITVSAHFAAVHRARGWLELKAKNLMTESEQRQFLAFASEFLMNAYEHGSLKISEEEKSALIESGDYNEELRRRELDCTAKIQVNISVVGDEIAINITDDGYGFNYKRYLEMSKSEMLDRIVMPNGRGIQMAGQYFDSVTFSKGGASVLLIKKVPKG